MISLNAVLQIGFICTEYAHLKIILAVLSMEDLLAGGLFSLAALEASLFRFPQ